MNRTIVTIIEFMKAGKTGAKEIEAAIAEIGQLQFRLIAINILSWLKSQKRMGKLRALELNEDHDWCRDLLHLMKDRAFLADLVHVKGTSVLLLSELAKDEVTDLLAFVDTEYRPRLMADPRR
jgi:hypothetical protein